MTANWSNKIMADFSFWLNCGCGFWMRARSGGGGDQ